MTDYCDILEKGHTLAIPSHGNFVNLIDSKFNKLNVIEYRGKKNNSHYWLCECSCNTLKIIRSSHLNKNGIQSCGCIKTEGSYNIKHGKSYSNEYNSWKGMKERCYTITDPHYINYGYRGIKVCERWLECFQNFYDDMGPRPSNKHSIDRINVNGNYCPENCRWATQLEQNQNKRNSIRLTYHMMTYSISEWSKIKNIKVSTIEARLRYGWSVDKTLETPVNHYNRKN